MGGTISPAIEAGAGAEGAAAPTGARLKLERSSTRMCFGCGGENPIGLRLDFSLRDGGVEADFTAGELHQGWSGIVHGGILFSLMDEAMGYAFFLRGINGVTARAETFFRRPAPIGRPLRVRASVARENRRLIETRASISLDDGTVLAEGKALMYVVSREPRAEAMPDPGSAGVV